MGSKRKVIEWLSLCTLIEGSYGKQPGKGEQFVPISTGLFPLALPGLVIWFWGESFLAIIIGGLLGLF